LPSEAVAGCGAAVVVVAGGEVVAGIPVVVVGAEVVEGVGAVVGVDPPDPPDPSDPGDPPDPPEPPPSVEPPGAASWIPLPAAWSEPSPLEPRRDKAAAATTAITAMRSATSAALAPPSVRHR
jgi:hypothetical protein